MQSESSEEFLSSVVIARSPVSNEHSTRTTRIGEIDRFERDQPLCCFSIRGSYSDRRHRHRRAPTKYANAPGSSLFISRLEAIDGSRHGDSGIRIYLEVELEPNSILLLVLSRLLLSIPSILFLFSSASSLFLH